jgi:hypothetical protein
MTRLLIKTGEEQGHYLELKDGVNRLGRRPDNDFHIEDLTISAWHCEVVLKNSSVQVRDLDSTNGTFINGQRIKEGQLQPGQTLQLGSVALVLEIGPVTIAIPDIDFAEPATPGPLPDGSAACRHHPSTPADYVCAKCGRFLCTACVHKLRRVGGRLFILCPTCSGPCEALPGKAAVKKKRSLLARLQETLRIHFRR